LLENDKLKHIGHKPKGSYAFVVPTRFLYHRYTILYSSLQFPHKRFGRLPHYNDSRAELDFLAGELAIKHQGVWRRSFRNTKHLEGDLE